MSSWTTDEADAFEAADPARPLSARAMGAARPAPYLDGLNPAQRDAVEALDGPVLMLAGAGTGKTKALTARIAHLLHTGRARPNEILAVTFTNKAAREMKHRVGRLVGGVVEGMPWLGTFHSLSREDPAPPRRAGRAEVELHHPRHRRPAPPAAPDRSQAAEHRREALAAAAARRPDRRLEEPRPDPRPRARRPKPAPSTTAAPSSTRQYQERLRTLNACDFGDLLLHVVTIFQTPRRRARRSTSAGSATSWSTNTRTPTSPSTSGCACSPPAHRNICCVGDDDQSIYGWRGAEVGNILRFEKDFPGAQGDPARAELPLDPAHPRRRLRRDRRQRRAASARPCGPTCPRARRSA